jgi:seryl-tRNA synthetase
MLDRKLVAGNPDAVRANLAKRSASEELLGGLDRLVAVINRRRELQTETDALRADRNSLSKQIGPMMKAGSHAEAEPLKAQVKEVGARLSVIEETRKEMEEEEEGLLMALPNLLADQVPEGKDEHANETVRTWGEPRSFDFQPKDHVAVGEDIGLLDFERAAKLSGARFPVYRGAGARLERALINYFLDRAGEAGYTEMIVPYIVSRTTMTGTGQLPKFEDDLFRLDAQLSGEDAFLIPTAEVPVTNLHRDEILAVEDLPLSYCAFTPCFRAEAGSYGRDVRGLIRQHQFHKVELVKLCTGEQAPDQLASLLGHAESLLQELELPHRVQLLCGGDTGFSAHITYDIEVWLPSQKTYREISSCSWFGDFQARRLKMRHRPDGGGKPQLMHTVNGSGLAVGRTVVGLLENHQEADGSVSIPDVLRPYMGGLASIPANG